MRDVAIIGAGELGGALAHVLARRDVASSVRLIDEAGRVAEGTALDIRQSSPIEGFSTKVSGSTDLATAAGAALIVVADRAGAFAEGPPFGYGDPRASADGPPFGYGDSRASAEGPPFGYGDPRASADGRPANPAGEWQGEDALLLLKRLSQLAARSLVLCAGATHRELVERGVRELRFARERLFGSAPEALAAAVRAMVALETNGSPRDVGVTVLGVPPSQVVVPWEEATVGGLAATTVLDEPARRRLAARVAPLWPPGPYALAWAAAQAIEAVFGRSRRTLSGFIAPDDSNGRRARTGALPLRLGLSGVVKVELPSLNVRDRVALDNAMLL